MVVAWSQDPSSDGSPDDLSGLARAWDTCEELRHYILQRKSLLTWKSAKSAGRISFDSLQMNIKLMEIVVQFWCPRVATPKTMVLDNLKWQVWLGFFASKKLVKVEFSKIRNR